MLYKLIFACNDKSKWLKKVKILKAIKLNNKIMKMKIN